MSCRRRRFSAPGIALGLSSLVAVGPVSAGEPAREREAYARLALAGKGDAARGRAVFFDARSAGCASCHRARGEGADVGPDLSDVGGKYGREHLVESVLEP